MLCRVSQLETHVFKQKTMFVVVSPPRNESKLREISANCCCERQYLLALRGNNKTNTLIRIFCVYAHKLIFILFHFFPLHEIDHTTLDYLVFQFVSFCY